MIALIINTSLTPWLSARPLGESTQGVAIRLAMEGFAFPLFPAVGRG